MLDFEDFISIYLKANRTCNLRCKHCYNVSREGEMTFEQVKYTLDWIDKFILETKQHQVFPCFFGGEPIICKYKDYILNHWKEQAKNNWGLDSPRYTEIGITTNLTFKPEEVDHNFLKQIDYIATSWDAKDVRWQNETQYKWWLENCKAVNSYSKNFAILVTLTDDLTSLPVDEFIKKMNEIDCPTIKFNELIPSNNPLHKDLKVDDSKVDMWLCELWDKRKYCKQANYYFDQLIESIKKLKPTNNRCGRCSTTSLSIDVNGDVSVCPSSTYIYSNIFINTPRESIESPLLKRYKILERFKRKDCVNCEWFDCCNGGCFLNHDLCFFPKQLALRIKENLNGNN